MKLNGFLVGVLFYIPTPPPPGFEVGGRDGKKRKEEVEDWQGLSRSSTTPSELGREK